MKKNLILIDSKEFKNLCGVLSVCSILSLITNLKFSLMGYTLVILLLLISKAKQGEEVLVDSENTDDEQPKDVIVLKIVKDFENEKVQKIMYRFNSIGLFLIFIGIVSYDVLVNLKII